MERVLYTDRDKVKLKAPLPGIAAAVDLVYMAVFQDLREASEPRVVKIKGLYVNRL